MRMKTLLIVPTFDNSEAIAQVTKDSLARTSLDVLIVDDGSRLPVAEILRRDEITDARLHLVRHEKNLGKGRALCTAFAWALAHGYTHVLSLDGDGQHLASAVNVLLEEAESHPFAVIIGARRFSGENVPGASRFGRKFSNFWVHFQTGVAVSDSQCGMRIYPLFHLQTPRFFTSRYEFEIEVLVRLLWAGVRVQEVAVDVVYPPKDERVSHFRKGWDNTRISLLNTVLVTWSLFTRHLGPKKMALATLTGAALATLPLSGGLVFTLMALSTVLLQVNGWIMLAWFVAGITWPTLWPLLWAVAATVTVGLLAVERKFRNAEGKTWTGVNRGGRFGNYFLRTVSRYLGRGATYFCLAFITPYFYWFAPRAKRASLEFFGALKPEASWLSRRADVLRHFFTFGMVLLDRLFQSFHPEPVFELDVQGRELFDRASARGKGLVLLTAHVGGWDLSTRVLAGNPQGRASVIAEFVAPGKVTSDQTVRKDDRNMVTRASFHNERLPILAYKEMLDQGQVIGMMGDRPLSKKLVLVPFMGRLAAFDLTPIKLAMSVGAELLFTFAFKTGYGSYELLLEPSPVPPAGLDKDEAAESIVRGYAESLERHLRRHPHQWFNFYPFFSMTPTTV